MIKYYTVYKTVNDVNGKYYIGSHQTYDLDDDYLGSGVILKKALKKHGRGNFTKEILCLCENLEVMRDVERHLVKYAIETDPRMCYNIAHGGTGAVLGEGNAFYGKKHTEEVRKRLSEMASERIGEANPFYGRRHSKETIDKIRASRPNSDNCKAMRDYYLNKQKVWWCTPTGCYYSAVYASLFTSCSKATVMRRCKNPDKVIKPNYQIPEEYWGKTWREVGYYCVEKVSGCD